MAARLRGSRRRHARADGSCDRRRRGRRRGRRRLGRLDDRVLRASSSCCWRRAGSTARASASARPTISVASPAQPGFAAISLLALAAVVGGSASDVDQTLRLWLFATVYVGAGRVALNWSHRRARIAGEGLRPTLIVGAGRVGRLAAARLLDKPEVGLKPIGFLDKDPLTDDGSGVALPVLGASWDLEQVVREHDVEQVIITFSTAPNDVLLRLVRRCEELGVAVAVVPRLYEQTTTRLSVDHIGGLPLVSAQRLESARAPLRAQVRARPDRQPRPRRRAGAAPPRARDRDLLSRSARRSSSASAASAATASSSTCSSSGRCGWRASRTARSSSWKAWLPAASRAPTAAPASASSCARPRSTSCRSSSTSCSGT